MNWRIINTSLVFLTLIFFCSCDKQEEQGFIRLDITNYSDITIDTIKVYSYSFPGGYTILTEPIVFWDLKPGSVTEKRDVQDVEYFLDFIGYVEGDTMKGWWYFPTYPMDPAQPIFMPNGHYNFGIIECDTVIGKMVIGLINEEDLSY